MAGHIPTKGRRGTTRGRLKSRDSGWGEALVWMTAFLVGGGAGFYLAQATAGPAGHEVAEKPVSGEVVAPPQDKLAEKKVQRAPAQEMKEDPKLAYVERLEQMTFDEVSLQFAELLAGTDPDGDWKREMVMLRWVELDAAAGFRMMRDLCGNSPVRGTCLSGYLGFWTAQQPTEAMAGCELLTGMEKEEAVTVAANHLAEQNPAALLEYLSAGTAGGKMLLDPEGAEIHTVAGAVGRWALTDPRAALEGVERLEGALPATTKDLFKAQVAEGWALKNPGAALAWVQELPKGRGQNLAAAAALRGMLWADPAAAGRALANFKTLGISPDSNGLRLGLKQLADRDLSTALAWTRKWLDPQVASEWEPRLLAHALPASAGEAVRLLSQLPPDSISNSSVTASVFWQPSGAWDALAAVNGIKDPARQTAVRGLLLGAASQEDPARAAPAIMSLPEGTQQAAAAVMAGQHWAKLDPEQASTWLNTQKPGPARDSFIQGFVTAAAWEDPKAAMQWAGSMQNAQAKRQYQLQVIQTWANQDAAGARAFLSENPTLEPATRQMLTEIIKRINP